MATLQTIIKVQQAINDAGDTADAVMKIVAEQACEATGAPGAVVELAEFGEMVYTTTAGSLAGTEGLRLAMSGSMSGECVRTGKILISTDTETDPPRVDLEACRRVHARSMIVVPPLVDGNRTQGVLKVICGEPNAFSDDDVLLLEQLAQFIAKALARANVMDAKAHAASVDAHGSGQPGGVSSELGVHDFRCRQQWQSGCCGPLHRPRRVQADQRCPWPPGR